MAFHSAIGERLPLRLAVCAIAVVVTSAALGAAAEPPHSAELDAAIIKQAKRNGVPEKLVRRIVMRESKYDARARNRSYWGLMQISYPTARSMGFKGTPEDLLNPFVNLTYAVPYLANAFIIAGKQEDAAVRLYASGYYQTAKQRGLLNVLRTADTKPVFGEPDVPLEVAAAAPPPVQSYGVFGALFEPGQQPQSAPAVQTAYNAPDAAVTLANTPSHATPTAPDPSSSSPSESDHTARALQGDVEATDAPVTMTADKSGVLHPPKKWLHDGGMSNIARGEQGIEQVAAFDKTAGTEKATHRRVSQTRSRKNTTFAAIDMPPAAQAYAAGSQDAPLAQTDSQTAIQQATGGSQANPGNQAPAEPGTTVPTPEAQTSPAAEHAKARHATRSAQKDRADGTTRVAKDDVRSTSKHLKAKKPTETIASQRPDDGQLRPTTQ